MTIGLLFQVSCGDREAEWRRVREKKPWAPCLLMSPGSTHFSPMPKRGLSFGMAVSLHPQGRTGVCRGCLSRVAEVRGKTRTHVFLLSVRPSSVGSETQGGVPEWVPKQSWPSDATLRAHPHCYHPSPSKGHFPTAFPGVRAGAGHPPVAGKRGCC